MPHAWRGRLLGALVLMSTMLLSTHADAGPLRYLALGDSYTIGEGVADGGRWPEHLVAALRGDGVDIAPPRIIATTGWTTDELSAAMDAQEPLGRWDLVSLLIGVNNQYRGRPADDFRREFDRMLRRALTLAGPERRVFVLNIPDWGITPFAEGRDRAAVARDLDAYNTVIAEVCATHRVPMVDITALYRARGAEAAMLVEDGLHPSAAMYAAWAAAAMPAVRTLLREERGEP